MADETPATVREFWINEVGPKGWYIQDDALDAEIRARFGQAWEDARHGKIFSWCTNPDNVLAFLILIDQFPRNMFRGDARAFQTDRLARRVAYAAVSRHWDQSVDAPERQFYFLPFMHSEYIADQDRSVRLFLSRMPEGNDNIRHAIAHREVIREFGRFPYRNDALGRGTTPEEQAFLEAGGYSKALNAVPA